MATVGNRRNSTGSFVSLCCSCCVCLVALAGVAWWKRCSLVPSMCPAEQEIAPDVKVEDSIVATKSERRRKKRWDEDSVHRSRRPEVSFK